MAQLTDTPATTIKRRMSESIAAKQALADDDALRGQLESLVEMIVASLRDGGKLLFFGNGGSAADATHLAAEFVGRYRLERQALPALSLSDNVSSVTAIGNDYAYEDVFVRPIAALGSPGDVAIGLSTSGGSKNVINGLQAARQNGLRTVAITGERGLRDPGAAELCMKMPSSDTARIQECTMLVGHTMCELVEAALAA